MKTMFGAIALVLAAPVAAQSAPAPDLHAGHHQGAPEHKQGEKHDMECCKMPCCDKMKQQGDKAKSTQPSQHSNH